MGLAPSPRQFPPREAAAYLLGAAGSSMTHGHTTRTSLTLPLLFLMTVIFM